MNTMKSVVVAVGLSMASCGAAIAADMTMYGKTPAPVTTTYDWTGLYFGGHIGGGWEQQTFNDPVGWSVLNAANSPFFATQFASGLGSPNVSSSSFLGGLQAGANYQIGRLVLGSEFDVSWTHFNNAFAGTFPKIPISAGSPVIGTESFTSSSHWIATATTRLGVARDNWLFYGKAGAAWTGTNNGVSMTQTLPLTPATTLAGTLSDTRVGWTVGTGIEWAFARNWTTKLEYDYADFGTKVENIPAAGTSSFGAFPPVPFAANLPVSISQSVSTVKWGVNYKFDPGFLFW
jgi:outer membrane immunogenic protein